MPLLLTVLLSSEQQHSLSSTVELRTHKDARDYVNRLIDIIERMDKSSCIKQYSASNYVINLHSCILALALLNVYMIHTPYSMYL